MSDHAVTRTIYAPSSGAGRAALAVIRISGSTAFAIIKALTRKDFPAARQLVVRRIYAGSDLIDEAMVAVFHAPASFTGEAMAEIHCHGGRAVVADVCRALEKLGAVLAEPGQFSKRAFLNGRMSLSAAEGLADLIAAETAAQRRQAMRLVQGTLGNLADRWRALLIDAAALLEVTIDWADEEVPEDVVPEVKRLLLEVQAGFAAELARAERAERVRTGFQIALVGLPNSGKSTLLNALAGRKAAIVSDTPGTTRDVIEVAYDLKGLPVFFLDMAGVRKTCDPIEEIGVKRARERAASADLRLFLRCYDSGTDSDLDGMRQAGDLSVWTKSDLKIGPGDVVISAKTGDGLSRLLDLVYDRLASNGEDEGLISHMRHRKALCGAKDGVDLALGRLDAGALEVVAADLRSAIDALNDLIGHVGVEDVLDQVFSRFCLGK